jgi:hypothetical protein
MYIDTDTLTVLHGPLVWVEDEWFDDDHDDDNLRVLIEDHGQPVGRIIP